MKKLVVVALIATLVGCSKEAEFSLQESAKQQVEYSSEGSFDVGTVDSDGITTITYNITELKELCACAISEEMAKELEIELFYGSDFYLTGIGESSNSFTTFAVALTQSGNTLSWDDNAEILTCETTASTPCDLDIVSADAYDCSNQSGTCGQTVIGGNEGASYADCEFPWLVTKKDNK